MGSEDGGCLVAGYLYMGMDQLCGECASARLESGLNLPTGTGPETAVTGQTGPDRFRFRFRPVSNMLKFKI